MDVESLAKQLILQNMTPEQQKAVLASIRESLQKTRQLQKQKVTENVQQVVQALKKIEADIRSKYDDLGNKIEQRVASIKDGKDGKDGKNGANGRDGRDGSVGPQGPRGKDGLNGKDGRDGVDGVSVTDAHIDFDGSLIISLSSGRTINVGEVVAPDLAEKIKVITNGGGTSQTVLDTLASLQTQINNLIPNQFGQGGKFLTTDGSVLSWAPIVGGLSYQGTWNASTNSPALASGVGTNGHYYVVSTAGSTNLDGITDWQIGDWVIFNGTSWQKIDQTNLVTSVNGQTGAVSLTTTNINEGTNLYYLDSRARQALSSGTGISYDNSTGVITNSAPDQTVALTAGTGISTTGTYPNFTIANTAPDQTVALTAGTGISTSGTYPNFTIANTAPDQTVALTASTGISISGTYPNFTITNSAPDQTVSLTGAGTTTITGTYPNFTISSADQYQGTVTSVTGTSPVTSTGGTTPAIGLASGYGDTQNPYASKTANYVLAAPDGTSGAPTFRAIVAADIPTLNQNTTGTAANVTGVVAIANGGTGQTTANAAFNALAPSQASQSGKYLTTDGTNTSWATVNAGASLSNDTSTTSNLFPLFANATSGTPTVIYTSNAKLLYKPSTGELQSSALVASNGIMVNSTTVSSSYTIASGQNGMSIGPVTVNSGVTVTVSSGQRWLVL